MLIQQIGCVKGLMKTELMTCTVYNDILIDQCGGIAISDQKNLHEDIYVKMCWFVKSLEWLFMIIIEHYFKKILW